jgi:hypothetical protein
MREIARETMNPRISMITLGVDDLEASIRFYRDGIGFPKMDSPPEVAFFTLNGTWLGLYGRKALAEDAGVSPDGSGFPGFTLSHNVTSEADVDQIIETSGLCRCPAGQIATKGFLGRIPRLFQRSRRLFVGDRLQPVLLGRPRGQEVVVLARTFLFSSPVFASFSHSAGYTIFAQKVL